MCGGGVGGCGKKEAPEPQTKQGISAPQADVSATTTQVTGGSPAPLLPATNVATAAPAPEPPKTESKVEVKKPLTKEESAKVIEKAIRKSIKNPTGELTKADYEKVEELRLSGPKITDAGLKDLGKLQNLTSLIVDGTQITDAGLLGEPPNHRRWPQGSGQVEAAHTA